MIIRVEFFGDLFFEINLFYYEKIPYKQRVKTDKVLRLSVLFSHL